MTTRAQGAHGLGDIGLSLFWRGQEVEHSPVVPHVIPLRAQRNFGDVADQPASPRGISAEVLPGYIDGILRDIEYADITIVFVDSAELLRFALHHAMGCWAVTNAHLSSSPDTAPF